MVGVGQEIDAGHPGADGAGGTVLTQRREAPDGISSISRTLTDKMLGGVANFQVELGAGMRETLAKIKVDAER